MYVLMTNKEEIAIAKSFHCNNVAFDNEIQITEEQYEQINEFPLILKLNDKKKVICWEKTEIPHEEPIPVVAKPTIEERLQLAEDALNFLLGL